MTSVFLRKAQNEI